MLADDFAALRWPGLSLCLAIASNRYTVGRVERPNEVAAALRQIARGFGALADAVAGAAAGPPEQVRVASLLREWGGQGLSRGEASALFRKHGFAPQTAGGWARSNWIETRPDGRRYITESSRQWLAGQEDADGDG